MNFLTGISGIFAIALVLITIALEVFIQLVIRKDVAAASTGERREYLQNGMNQMQRIRKCFFIAAVILLITTAGLAFM